MSLIPRHYGMSGYYVDRVKHLEKENLRLRKDNAVLADQLRKRDDAGENVDSEYVASLEARLRTIDEIIDTALTPEPVELPDDTYNILARSNIRS